MKPIRREGISIDFLSKWIKDMKIRIDHDVQRSSGQWKNNMMNELIYTALSNDHIPALIIGEEEREDGTSQQWVIDGLQRLTTLVNFRIGAYKITSTLENPIVEYTYTLKDKDKKVVFDEDGEPIIKTETFDIRNKYFKDLPAELQENYCYYSLPLTIHQECDLTEVSKLIRRYNNHVPMNVTQRAFTFADAVAKQINKVTNNKFFIDCGKYSETDKRKGVIKRVVAESIMTCFFLDNWKSQPLKMFKYINEHSKKEQIESINRLFDELYDICVEKYPNFFNTKNSCVFVRVWQNVKAKGVTLEQFAEVLDELADENDTLKDTPTFLTYDEFDEDTDTWAKIDSLSGTKDSRVIRGKIKFLTDVVFGYLGIEDDDEDTDEEEDLSVSSADSLNNYINSNIKDKLNSVMSIDNSMLETEKEEVIIETDNDIVPEETEDNVFSALITPSNTTVTLDTVISNIDDTERITTYEVEEEINNNEINNIDEEEIDEEKINEEKKLMEKQLGMLKKLSEMEDLKQLRGEEYSKEYRKRMHQLINETFFADEDSEKDGIDINNATHFLRLNVDIDICEDEVQGYIDDINDENGLMDNIPDDSILRKPDNFLPLLAAVAFCDLNFIDVKHWLVNSVKRIEYFTGNNDAIAKKLIDDICKNERMM